MDNSYVVIANSINNLTTHQLIRRPLDVNNHIIKALQEKNVNVRNGGDIDLLSAYDNKLRNLNKELRVARSFNNNMVSNLPNPDNDGTEAFDN